MQTRSIEFSVIHPTARPGAWRSVYLDWLDKAQNAETVEYVLVADRRWGFDELPAMLRPQDRAIWNTGRKCYVDAVNCGAAYVTGATVIVNADDQWPAYNWDAYLARYTNANEDVVLHCATGTPSEFDRGIIVMPVLSRSVVERWGTLLYPAYESMYSDNDLYERARHEGIYIRCDSGTVFPHRHPLFTSGVNFDAAYEAQNRDEAYVIGESILRLRRENGFKDIPQAISYDPTPDSNKRNLAVLLPGEKFCALWVSHWIALSGYLAQHYNLNVLNGYCSNVYDTRIKLTEQVCGMQDVELVLWIDDDNLLSAAAFRNLVAALDANPSLSGIVGWTYSGGIDGVDTTSPRISCGPKNSKGENGTATEMDLNRAPSDVLPITWSGFPAALFRADCVKALGPLAFMPIVDPKYDIGFCGEDIAFFARAEEAGYKFAVHRQAYVPHLKLQAIKPSPVYTGVAAESNPKQKEAVA